MDTHALLFIDAGLAEACGRVFGDLAGVGLRQPFAPLEGSREHASDPGLPQALEDELRREQAELRRRQTRSLREILSDLRSEFEKWRGRAASTPFCADEEVIVELAWTAFHETGAPLMLVAPFGDESQPVRADTPAGGLFHLRTTITRTWARAHCAGDLVCLDGYFQRPLRQMDFDIQRIRAVLRDLPIILVHGYVDGNAVYPLLASWNVVPDEPPNLIAKIDGRAALTQDETQLGIDLAELIGRAVAGAADRMARAYIDHQEALAAAEVAREITQALAVPPAVAVEPIAEPEPVIPAPVASYKAGEILRDGDSYPQLVVVPAGSFLMGSPDYEGGRDSDEGPRHEVAVEYPFAIGRYAVTFAEWDLFAASTGGYRPSDEGWGRDRRPVVNVSWHDARGYVDWLSEQTGEPYRLPSEAEWEYACRAGASTPFWWGATISAKQANYDANYTYGGGSKGETRERTVAVDAYDPNPFGLYNVHGNVWEWVEDGWHNNYMGALDTARPWLENSTDSHRVLRGGSWGINPRFLRAAFRYASAPGNRINNNGFRVAKTLVG